MTRHLVVFPAFFSEAQPQPVVHRKDVFHVHAERGGDTRKAVDHRRNDRAISQTRSLR